MVDLKKVMATLANKRPIFHSEADFQHALAWEIHHQWPRCSMRLEFKPPHLDSRIYLDIWASNTDTTLAIELKYKTRGLRTTFEEEAFDLLDQSAQDIGRYDFLKDIQRLELIISGQNYITGYGILLTNDSSYWSKPRSDNTVDADFRIHDGRELKGELRWSDNASIGTMHGREEPINLKGTYKLQWKDYSQPSMEKCSRFRYLLVKVEGGY